MTAYTAADPAVVAGPDDQQPQHCVTFTKVEQRARTSSIPAPDRLQ